MMRNSKEEKLLKNTQNASKFSKFINVIYGIWIAFSFLYYSVYAVYNVLKYGWDIGSITLVVFASLYLISIVICYSFSSTSKKAKKRLNKTTKNLKLMKKFMKVVQLLVSLIVLLQQFQSTRELNVSALVVAVGSLTLAVFKLLFAIVKRILTIKIKKYVGEVKNKYIPKKEEIKEVKPLTYEERQLRFLSTIEKLENALLENKEENSQDKTIIDVQPILEIGSEEQNEQGKKEKHKFIKTIMKVFSQKE